MSSLIYIAESGYPDDLFINSLDGRALASTLSTMQIGHRYRTVLSKETLTKAINKAANIESLSAFHLSCHGDEAGISLGERDQLEWDDLADLLQPIAKSSILLSVSSCQGGDFSLARAFHSKRRKKFGWIVGSEAREPDLLGVDQACIAWAILYFTRHRGDDLKLAIRRMNATTGGSFVVRTWYASEGGYRRYPSKDIKHWKIEGY